MSTAFQTIAFRPFSHRNDMMSKAHNEDVAGWILRLHFDSANENKIVRNLADQGKNLKCFVNEGRP